MSITLNIIWDLDSPAFCEVEFQKRGSCKLIAEPLDRDDAGPLGAQFAPQAGGGGIDGAGGAVVLLSPDGFLQELSGQDAAGVS